MSAKAAPTCPNCHGPLPLGGEARVIKCDYCGREVMREQAAPPAGAPPGGGAIGVAVQRQTPPVQVHAPKIKWMIIVLAVLPLIVGGIIFSVVARKVQQAKQAATSTTDRGGYAPKGEHLQWSGTAPVPADIDGDGVEDFVGRFRILDDGETEVFLGAFDGKSLKRLWKAGPYADNNGARFVELTVSGDRVLVSDPNMFVHVLELGTGKELRAVRLTDKVQELCLLPDDDAKVWIAVADEKNLLLDLATGEIMSFGRPGHCPDAHALNSNSDCWRVEFHRNRRAHATCLPSGEAPALEGFGTDYVLADGQRRVAIGTKHPGTSIPMVMGFEGSGKKASVTWSRKLGGDAYEGNLSVTDMIDDRVIIPYRTKKRHWRLTALETATGKTIYDVEIPRSKDGSAPSEMHVTASRVYVPHWTWLDVFDIASGEHLGTVGIW